MRKVALITGTSSGIGYETAIFLAQKGYKVYASMRNLDKSRRLQEKSDKDQLDIECCLLDVTKTETIDSTVEKIVKKEQSLDILVNNAGFAVVGKFEESSNEDFEKQLATNFYGALNCTRSVLPIMKKQKSGCVINVSSVLGIIGTQTLSAYCASKFAMEGWSESIRYELKRYGIYIVLLEPGFFETEIFNNVQFASGKQDTKKIESMGATPLKVADKIYKITRKKYPRIRYSVGYDCKAANIVKRLLPSLLSEKILEKV